MNKNLPVKMMTACAIMAAIMCVVGPLSIPIGPIPLSLINLAIYFSVYILGTRGAFWSYLVYVILGSFGLPVFSGFSGGLAKLMGPTGGFIIGFFITIITCGILFKLCGSNRIICIIVMIVTTAISYAFGVIWFIILMDCELMYALTVCVIPFIPGDLAKIIIAAFIAPQISRRIKVNI